MAQKSAVKEYSRLLALICVWLPIGAKQAIAQNIAPANDGTNTVIHNDRQFQRFDITDGTTSSNGANLFHSFEQFNLNAGQTANFIIANPNIQNILGRVTGGNASIINGLIQVTGGNPNLYLMNPAGVLFGPNASLNVPASFSVTTATGIGVGNNWFNAIGSNDYQNLVGTPSGYRFDVSQPGAIVNAGNLELSPGEDLTLTGGTVINTGELSTPGGNVTIAAVEGGDTIRISQAGHILNLEVSNFGGNQEEITPLSLPGLLTAGNFNSNATGMRVNEKGQVVLTAGSLNPVSQRNRVSGEAGVAIASGSIDTSSSQEGGQVNISGSRVGVLNANINAEGNVRLQADNDITVDREIKTSGSVELKAGRSININADIDTSTGNGNISLLGNDNGANAANRSGGAANINQRENTTLNAGSGNITIRLGKRGEVGDINLENLTTTGRVLINANGGNIGRVSPNSLITAGGAVFRTSGSGGIGLANTPLRLDVEKLEATAGSGGAYFDVLGRVTVGGVREDVRGIRTADGGDVVLSAERKITVTEGISTRASEGKAGDISLESRVGGIDTTASRINTSSESGRGGDISLNAVRDILTGDLNAFSSGNRKAGNISMESREGGIDTTAGIVDAFSFDGNGGNVEMRASGNISTAEVVTDSGEFILDEFGFPVGSRGGRGNAGKINMESTTGSIDTTAGSLLARSASGNGGDITQTAADNIATVSIDSYSFAGFGNSGDGGDITVTAGSAITIRELSSFAAATEGNSGDGGDLVVTAGGALNQGIVTSASLATLNSGNGGDIAVTAGGDANIEQIFSASLATLNSGNGGDIAVTAGGDFTVEDIHSFSAATGVRSGDGGAIFVTADTVNVDSSRELLRAYSFSTGSNESGNGGNVEITANNITNMRIMTLSTYSDSGVVTITNREGENLQLRDLSIITSQQENIKFPVPVGEIPINVGERGQSGNVSIASVGNIDLDNVRIQSDTKGKRSAGDVSISSTGGPIIFNNSDIVSNTSARGNAGNITIDSPEEIEVTNNSRILANTAAAGNAGSIKIDAGSVEIANGAVISSSTFAIGDAGSIYITAEDAIVFDGSSDGFLTGAFSEVGRGAEGNGGDVTVEAGSVEVTNGAEVSSSALGRGDAGSVSIMAKDTVVIDGERSNASPSGAFSEVGRGAEGNAGDVTIEAGSVEVTNGAEVSSSTLGRGDAGSVSIMAKDTVVIDGERSNAFPSGAFSEVGRGAEGNAGDVTVTTDSLEVTNGATISSSTSGLGHAGSVNITAEKTALFDGDASNGNASGAFSEVRPGAEGNAGDVTVTTDSLEVTNGATISSSTSGLGHAGSVNITARETAVFDGEGSKGNASAALSEVMRGAEGNAGDVTVTTDSLEVTNGATISSSTSGLGDAGSVNITAEKTALFDGEGSNGNARGAFSDAKQEAEGDGGDLIITTGSLEITNNAIINVGSFGTGNAGGIEIVTDSLRVSNGARIDASIFGTGDAGSVNIKARETVVFDGEGSGNFSFSALGEGNTAVAKLAGPSDTGVFSTVQPGALGNAGGITIETGSVEVINGAEISTSSRGQGDAGSIKITTPLININGGEILAFTETTGNAGDIFITSAEILNISGKGEIRATTSSSGNAGSVDIQAQNLTLSNGADITAATTGAGNAGTINLQANRIDILENSDILAFTEGSGAGGNITVRAPETLNLDANTRLSVETSSAGRAGNIAIASNIINLGRGGEISATATATSTNTEDGGNISINTNQLNITGQLGIFAETAGEADAGTLTINPYNNNQDLNITFSNDGFISASTSSTGNGGNISIYAPESISITGDGNIFVQTTGTGNAGSIEIETDNLRIADNTSISASTEGSGNAGSINITTETFTLERGTSLTTETDNAGQAGNIEITSRELTISDNAQISATARSGASSKQPGGNITINASELLISGELGIFAETAGDAEAGTLTLNSYKSSPDLNITFANDGFISARTTATGNGGNINIFAPEAVNISGDGFISVETTGSGNAGTINIDTQDLTLTGGVAISAETNSPGAAGNININSQTVTIGEGTSISATAREASTATEAGGNISINASELLISGELGIFAETAGESPAGTLNLNSHESDRNLKITFTNDGFISARTTSSGNGGNINIFAPDGIDISGRGRITVESTGSGNAGIIDIETRNLSIAERTTISAATFNGGGDGGSININPSGTFRLQGSILTETRGAGEGGNIAINTGNLIAPDGSISARSTGGGNAGNINITTRGNAITGIVTSSANNREQPADGGNIEIVSVGGFIEATQPIQSFSNQGDAGDVNLQAQTDIATNTISSHGQQQGGQITITAETGNIDTSNGSLTNYSGGGAAGNVSLEAPRGSITTGNIYSYANQDGGQIAIDAGGSIEIMENSKIISASEPSTTGEEASGRGGDIILEAGGNINTTAARIYSGADDGDTGTVEITGESNIQLGQIDLASGFVRERLEINDNFTLIPRPQGPATSGVAGNISITSNNGTIDTSAGTINSRSPDGSGNITLNALGNITAGNLSASALNPETPTRGGDIEIISRQGEINATQPLETFSERGTAGNVTLTAEGSVRTDAILSQGTQKGGDINIESRSENSIDAAGALNTYSTEGTAGNVAIASPGSITLSGIRSEGRERGGSISVTSEVGQISSTEDIDSFSESGVGGNVELNASRDVNIANVSSYGLTQSGDLLIQSQTAGVNAGNVTTQAPGGDSGSIVINGQTVGTGDLSSIGTTSAGAINVEATDGSIATYDVEIRSDGTVGAITLRATEDVNTGDIDQEAGEGDANLDIDSGGDQNIGDINQVAEEGNANINIESGGDQTIGNINQTAGGDATNVQTAGGNQTIGNINQTAGGDAINVQTAGGNQTIGNINQTAGGDAINVQTAGGNQTIGNINQTAGGDAINVQTAGGNQTIGNINQTAGGDAINVQTAGGNQIVGVVTQDGGNDAINVQVAGGEQNLGAVNQTFGNESINIQNPGVTQNLQVIPNNNTSILNTGDFNTDSQTAIAPNNSFPNTLINNVGVGSQGAIAPNNSLSNPNTGTSNVNVSSQGIVNNDSLSNNASIQNITTAISNPQGGSNSQSNSSSQSDSIINNTDDTQQILERISIINPTPMTVVANTQTLTMLEENRNQEFADYLGLDLSEDVSAIKNVREVLTDIEKQTYNRSAVLYTKIYPEQLQLILFTPDGEPVSTILPISREQLTQTVKQFRGLLTRNIYRHTKRYLPAAQQLYQWLIAPIAAELESANIDTLVFSLDSGLRMLPVAALHDGEQFLIENYSLSLIPSISLMDTRYKSLKDSPILAMGASEFTELNPLPAVPVELETITTKLWQGNALIDEEFTVSNLIAQREQQTYPIIHLATHGEFKPGDVSNSYIQFWGEEKLTLDRVRELGLNNPTLELLVLSACRTAVGDANAELGFAGLAVAAGVKSAVASLWYVSDEGTLGLMTEFYSHLDEVTIKAEALRQAQLAMLRGEVEVAEGELRGSFRGAVSLPPALAHIENNNLSHPYYWAAFTTIGSPW